MPSCAFRKCNNNTKNTNKANGVTFHAFPKDPRYKEIWNKVIQRDQNDETWLATSFSRICSDHFKETDFYITPKGRRKLNLDVVPVLHPTTDLQDFIRNYKDFLCDKKEENDSDSSLRNVQVSDTESIFDTPTEIHLKKKLDLEKSKNFKCRRENLKLKKRNKYLISKLSSLQESTKALKKENFILRKNQMNLHMRLRAQTILYLQTSKKGKGNKLKPSSQLEAD